MRAIRHLILHLFFLQIFTTPCPCEAANLVGVIVANTLPREFNIGREHDIQNMLYEMDSIAQLTGLSFTPYIFIHENYNSELLDNLEKITINDDDVVFFFYSGHGYREYDKDPVINPWPNLEITLEEKGIDHQVINEIFEEKNPRLLLSIVNSCNTKVHRQIELVKRKQTFMVDPPQFENNLKELKYRLLFLETRGKIIASSSIPGQVSYRDRETGSIYLNSLLDVIHEESKHEEITTWEVIFQRTSDLVYEKTEKKYKGPQVTQYLIEVY